jgi:hypothetical protein
LRIEYRSREPSLAADSICVAKRLSKTFIFDCSRTPSGFHPGSKKALEERLYSHKKAQPRGLGFFIHASVDYGVTD